MPKNPNLSYKNRIADVRYSPNVYPNGPNTKNAKGIVIAKATIGTKNTLIALGEILFKPFSNTPKHNTVSIAGNT